MQRTASGETVIIPRNFKLLAELEASEKGHGEMSISFGLVDPGDTFLSHWNGGILGPPGVSVYLYTNLCHIIVELIIWMRTHKLTKLIFF